MAGETARLRAATVEDAPAMAAIFLEARRAAMPYLPILYTDTEVLHWIEKVVLRGSNVLLAILDNKEVAGFAASRDGQLDHLYILPTLQQHGVGTQLLAAVKQAHPEGVRLHVFQRNTHARRFYENRASTSPRSETAHRTGSKSQTPSTNGAHS